METEWYCYGCGEEDRMADIKKCQCGKWYHKECVGLSVEDANDFECFDSSD